MFPSFGASGPDPFARRLTLTFDLHQLFGTFSPHPERDCRFQPSPRLFRQLELTLRLVLSQRPVTPTNSN